MAKTLSQLPPLFKGRTVWILGGGPTLQQLEGSDLLVGHTTLAVNSAVYLGDWVSALFFGDAKWYWWNEARVKAYPGPKFTMNIVFQGRDKSVVAEPDLMIVRRGRTFGHCRSDTGIGWNRSSGAAAIDLAVNMGATRVILLGFDMRRVNGEKNYRKHENDGKTNPNPWDYFMEGLHRLADDLSMLGFEVYNATPETALECFPKINFFRALSQFPE